MHIDSNMVGAIIWIVFVKLIGYVFVAALLLKRYENHERSPWVVGTTRTIVGWAGGATAMAWVEMAGEEGAIAFAVLALFRVIEWIVVFRVFLERPRWDMRRAVPRLAAAWAASFLLDVPVALGLIVPIALGGVC